MAQRELRTHVEIERKCFKWRCWIGKKEHYSAFTFKGLLKKMGVIN